MFNKEDLFMIDIDEMTPREVYLRVMILDELISHSGKQLDCYVIGDITKGLVSKISELDSKVDSNK